MADLTFDITRDGPTRVTIAVHGEIDMATAPQLLDYITDHADQDIVLDLSGVAFIDSRGIAALMHGYKLLDQQSHHLRTTGEQDNVLKVLDVTGVTDRPRRRHQHLDSSRRGKRSARTECPIRSTSAERRTADMA